MRCLFIALLLVPGIATAQPDSPKSDRETTRIVEVTREVYRKHPREKTAAMVSVRYIGPKLLREEINDGQERHAREAQATLVGG